MTKLQRLDAALAYGTTGGILPEIDDARKLDVLRALAAMVGSGAIGNTGRENYQGARRALEWYADQAVLAAIGREGKIPADVSELVHDLARLEYVQRTLDTVGGAFVGEEGSVHLDDDVKRALVGRVERWLKESADRRKAELHARVEAAKEKEK